MVFKTGKDNPRWNGGTSEYKDHCILKKRRLIILKKADNKCEICGMRARCVHHKDGDKSNHSLDNLQPLCHTCHGKERWGSSSRSKFRRLYGLTLEGLSIKYGKSTCFLSHAHESGRLNEFIENPNKFEQIKYGSLNTILGKILERLDKIEQKLSKEDTWQT